MAKINSKLGKTRDLQLARLTKLSQIEFVKENPEDPLRQAKFKNSFTNI